MDTINKKIKNIRKHKKFTQAHIANRLGITTRAYAKIENGETNLTIEKLYKITDILEINLSHLFEGRVIPKTDLKNNIVTTARDTITISLIKHYQETIILLKEQNEFLKGLLKKES